MQSLDHCPLIAMRLARDTRSKRIGSNTTPEYAAVAEFHYTLSLVCDVTNVTTRDEAALACILSFWNSPEYMRGNVNDCLECAPKSQEAVH